MHGAPEQQPGWGWLTTARGAALSPGASPGTATARGAALPGAPGRTCIQLMSWRMVTM